MGSPTGAMSPLCIHSKSVSNRLSPYDIAKSIEPSGPRTLRLSCRTDAAASDRQGSSCFPFPYDAGRNIDGDGESCWVLGEEGPCWVFGEEDSCCVEGEICVCASEIVAEGRRGSLCGDS